MRHSLCLLLLLFSLVSLHAQPGIRIRYPSDQVSETIEIRLRDARFISPDVGLILVGDSLYRKADTLRFEWDTHSGLYTKIAELDSSLLITGISQSQVGHTVYTIWTDSRPILYDSATDHFLPPPSAGFLSPFLAFPIVSRSATYAAYGCGGGGTWTSDATAVATPSARHLLPSLDNDGANALGIVGTGISLDGLPVEKITHLLEQVNQDPYHPPLIDDFGIDESAIEGYRELIDEQVALWESHKEKGSVLTEEEYAAFYMATPATRHSFLSLLASIDTITSPTITAAICCANRWGGSFSTTRSITLKNSVGDSLIFRSHRRGLRTPFDLPWHLIHGEDEIAIYDPRLVRTLMPLLPVDSLYVARRSEYGLPPDIPDELGTTERIYFLRMMIGYVHLGKWD